MESRASSKAPFHHWREICVAIYTKVRPYDFLVAHYDCDIEEWRGARNPGCQTTGDFHNQLVSAKLSFSDAAKTLKSKGPSPWNIHPRYLNERYHVSYPDAPQSAFLGSDITRVAGSFADFQLRNHNSFNNNPPLSAAVLNTNTNAFDYGPSVYTRRGSITQGVKGMYQNMPTRKPWEGDPYSLDMQGNIDESFAEHPRYGDFGERQRIPSRLPSAAASVDWEPFHDDAGYGRNSRQPSNMDMNPSSPKSLYQQRNSFHNRSFSHSSSSFLNDDNMRKSSQSLQGGDHQGNSQPEFVGRGSLSRLNTSDIAMHDHEQGHPMSPNYNHMGGGSPSRSSFPISPRSSQSNLFGQPYYKHQNNKRQSNTSKPPEEDDQGSYRRASSLLATNITYSDTMKTPEEATAAMNLNSAPIESDTAKEWHMPIDKPKEGDHSDS